MGDMSRSSEDDRKDKIRRRSSEDIVVRISRSGGLCALFAMRRRFDGRGCALSWLGRALEASSVDVSLRFGILSG